MKIEFELDESAIIRDIMSGKSKKEIEAEVARRVRNTIVENVVEKLQRFQSSIVSEYKDREVVDELKRAIVAMVKKEVTPISIAKLIKQDEWKSWFEDTVGNAMADFIEHALSEWMVISVGVKKGSKVELIEMAGKDSFTHRAR